MPVKFFIDTNILIYLYSKDEPSKSKIATNLINTTGSIISTQVVNELNNVLVKKFRVTPKSILKVIDEVSRSCEVIQINIETIKKALHLMEKTNYSYFDCLIIASALESECRILYTEDLQHSQQIGIKLKIMNPFMT